MASLYIKDAYTAELVAQLAKDSNLTKTALIREMAEERKASRDAALDREKHALSPRERMEKFWREHPLPPPTGLVADKAFYDELSGDL